MKKTLAALTATLIFAVASPAFAKDAATSTFSYEGVSYTYSQTQVGKTTVIEGYATPGDKFRFVKNGDKVTGEANGVSVSFRTDDLVTYNPSKAVPLAAR